jgi:hypothetical protein
MKRQAIFTVQGSAPEPYTIVVTFDPLTISCTCPASISGIPCKHRIQIINGFCENIVAIHPGYEQVLQSINEVARSSGIIEVLNEYEEIKNTLKYNDTLCNKSFKKYRDNLLRFALQHVKTNKNVEKAEAEMDKSVAEWLKIAVRKERVLSELRMVFVMPPSTLEASAYSVF